ncbi:MAG: AtpZ/AtpI family protein [Candidatus Paceibacterota bacterium]|jgi:predicted F0F1-ATPase subunit
MSQQQQKNIDLGYVMMMGGQLGLMIALPMVLTVALGVWIDKKANTFPLFLVIMILSGMGITIVNVYKVIIPFLEKRSERKNNKNINK